MPRFHATPTGRRQFTEEEELAWDAQEKESIIEIEKNQRKQKLKRATELLEAGAIEALIDCMEQCQRDELPYDMQLQYYELKELRNSYEE